ncbi:MAG: replicative DNA helicase [Ruminiclostridium sp.]|nr:replicative DNA helicase [Ruminiclostridium sp.]
MAELDISNIDLPYNTDAEQMVLGSAIADPELVAKIIDKLTPEHFHIKAHSGIYSVMQQMFVSGEDINIISLGERCVRQQVFASPEEAKEYLYKLSVMAVESSSIESYAQYLDEKFVMRQLINVSRDIFEKATSGTEEPGSLLEYAEKRILDIRSTAETSGLMNINPTVIDLLKHLIDINQHPENNQIGLSTGFRVLDKVIYGLMPSSLILIAARPGMGKTSFAMNMAVNAARLHRDKKIAIFSLEMSRSQLVERMLSSEGRINADKLKTGDIDQSQWRGLYEAAEMLMSSEIYVDDTAGITVGEMKAKLRRINNVGLVVIDYIGLVTVKGKNSGNRVAEVTEITRNMKVMAKEMNVPVIALSQLSRGPDNREDKRPLLSDLRDSGSAEQDADVVLFLYRDHYYHKEKTDLINSCECIVAKNRHGKCCTVQMRWEGEFTRFTSVEEHHEDPRG